jgi:hypothetical protein
VSFSACETGGCFFGNPILWPIAIRSTAMAARLVSPKSPPCEPCDHGSCHRQTRPRQELRPGRVPVIKKDGQAGRDYDSEVDEGDGEPWRRSKISPRHKPPSQGQGVCRRRWISMPWTEDRTGLLLLGQHIRKCRDGRVSLFGEGSSSGSWCGPAAGGVL